MEVAVMSLSARDRQALEEIEDGLAGSAPDLAAMLTIFSRLTSNEEMPAGETVREARRVRRPFPWLSLQRAAPVLWLLITIAALAIVVVVTRSGSGVACVKSWAVACASPAPAHSSRPARKTGADQAPPAGHPVPADSRPSA
jgi:Protein of unknown function (DUF3040)